jgi:F-type H+-transporting ATPase subunit epsilon
VATLHFELISPERVLFAGDVRAVMLPGAAGDMTVMPGHEPTVATLNPGIKREPGATHVSLWLA